MWCFDLWWWFVIIWVVIRWLGLGLGGICGRGLGRRRGLSDGGGVRREWFMWCMRV